MGERIWTGEDCNVNVYFDDGNGNRLNESGADYDPNVDSPLLAYCYWQSVAISGDLPMVRRPCTGRPRKRIVRDQYEYDASVAHFVIRFATEQDVLNIFNREKCLQFEIEGIDVLYSKDPEKRILKMAYARQFKITSQSSGNIEGSAEFWAEEFE
jgi:hypothetical protein